MKRAFIIHGWEVHPGEGWFPWLKKELGEKSFEVTVPQMPNPDEPKIEEWVPFLKEQVGETDEETFFIGHSIGCQTILRFLEGLGDTVKVGGVILVAGWVNLTAEVTGDKESYEIAKEWLETPLDWEKIKKHTDNFVSIFSNDDPYVPLGDLEIFKKELGSKIVLEHNKKHFSGSDNVKELPVVLEEILKMQ